MIDLDAIQAHIDDESERILWAQDEEYMLALIARVRELEGAARDIVEIPYYPMCHGWREAKDIARSALVPTEGAG